MPATGTRSVPQRAAAPEAIPLSPPHPPRRGSVPRQLSPDSPLPRELQPACRPQLRLVVGSASTLALNPAAAGAGQLRLEQLVGADTELGGDPLELRQVLAQQVLEKLAAA
eukprot:scaffold93899_cov27-Phaeocystis_antarctica.AAC.2